MKPPVISRKCRPRSGSNVSLESLELLKLMAFLLNDISKTLYPFFPDFSQIILKFNRFLF